MHMKQLLVANEGTVGPGASVHSLRVIKAAPKGNVCKPHVRG